MANLIFDYQLSPNGFRVFCLLSGWKNCFSTVVTSYQAIADACSIDAKTACRAVNELTTKELLVKEHRYNIRGYAKNKYTVRTLPGGWFKVEYHVLKAKLSASDFLVYCFIRKCMDAKKQEAFPSLSAISQGTGISRSRAVLAIRFLREHTYLNRVKRRYKKTRAHRQNRYLFFRLQQKKKEARLPKRTSFKQLIIKKSYFLIYIIERMVKNVKFFFLRGSPEIPKQLLDPQGYTIKKE
jgi:hypothetical protein